MSKYSISLTPKYRLDMKIVRQRGGHTAEPIFSKLRKLRRVRRGSKISRFFRHVFEYKSAKKLVGTNLAMAMLLSMFIPQASAIASVENEEKVVIAAAQSPLTTERKITYPVDEVIISQGYHLFHPGVDFDGITGDPIRAVMKGRVIEVQYSRFAYGLAVLIKHENGIASLYAHLSKIEVEKDQSVETGDKIGEMGATGRASGDHLHFEIRDQGRPINPLTVLPKL